ncbi:MAG: hypothetical protein Q8918_18415, partial [Bacteroidota bacterium]|nr:hypothetical protein [Bacteroidota bacterium]
MKGISGLDERIVNYVAGRLNKYLINKKKKAAEKSKQTWLGLFQNKDCLTHQLSDELKINLYNDSVLSKLIYDGFETSEIDFLNHFLEEGAYFIDLGGNVCFFSLFASRKIGPVGLGIGF